ncbi:uncharacterized mitochondrial protein-like protein [Tanacetum coccineum]|uniref:Uncharacterized mitochondrial protein-like protein n=1 Tax=Tanacetum coccineum TaxID=301880 RepID=A0ABQ5DKH3_9ASTR
MHWNKRFDDEIKKFRFTQNHDEPCVYKKASGSNVTFLILYVDDILIMGNHIPMLQDVKSYIGRCFAMKDLGEAAYILGIKIYRDRSKRLIEFEKMMHKKFQMSSMGELTFFLGLQVKQKEDGIFISQDKYVTEILKKFSFGDVKTASTPMETHKPLLKDADGEDVDKHMYRSMIDSLMYLTSSRPDIIYLKGQPKLGLWYPKDSPFDLVAYTDSDYAGASLDRKSTI